LRFSGWSERWRGDLGQVRESCCAKTRAWAMVGIIPNFPPPFRGEQSELRSDKPHSCSVASFFARWYCRC
jgi:hypothetical protein